MSATPLGGTVQSEKCGAWGGCVLPKGHNMGSLDIPENHKMCPPLSTEEYEPIRSALFDRRNGSASEARQAVANALTAAGFALIPLAEAEAAERALTKSFTTALTVKPCLDEPYSDDPRWTPWSRWMERSARESHDAAMGLRKILRGSRSGRTP